jgi:hypothetical protein
VVEITTMAMEAVDFLAGKFIFFLEEDLETDELADFLAQWTTRRKAFLSSEASRRRC